MDPQNIHQVIINLKDIYPCSEINKEIPLEFSYLSIDLHDHVVMFDHKVDHFLSVYADQQFRDFSKTLPSHYLTEVESEIKITNLSPELIDLIKKGFSEKIRFDFYSAIEGFEFTELSGKLFNFLLGNKIPSIKNVLVKNMAKQIEVRLGFDLNYGNFTENMDEDFFELVVDPQSLDMCAGFKTESFLNLVKDFFDSVPNVYERDKESKKFIIGKSVYFFTENDLSSDDLNNLINFLTRLPNNNIQFKPYISSSVYL